MKRISIFSSLYIVLVLFFTITAYGFDATDTNNSEVDKIHSFHKNTSKKNYDSLWVNALVLEQSEAGQKLLSNCLGAYGGVDKLEQLNGAKLTYETEAKFLGEKIKVEKYYERDNKYKIIRYKPDFIETRYFTYPNAWLFVRDTAKALEPARIRSVYYSYLSMIMPLGITNENFNEIRYDPAPEDQLEYLYLHKQDTLLLLVGIDPADNYVKHIEGMVINENKTYIYVNTFSDFQQYEGFIFATKMKSYSLGLLVADSELKKVDVNPGFNKNDFRPDPNMNWK